MPPGPSAVHVNARIARGMLAEHYCFGPGRGPVSPIPRHAHEPYQLALTLTNPGYYWYRGARLAMPGQSLTVIHTGEAHAVQSARPADAPAETRLLYLTPPLLQGVVGALGFGSPPEPYIHIPLVTEGRTVRLFLRLHRTLLEDDLQLAQDEQLLAAFRALLEQFGQGHAALPPHSAERHAVAQVREYLHAHYARNVSLAELAAQVQLSPFHLAHAFRRVTGTSPHAYLLHVRIDRAKTLLADRLPSAQVALEVGFAHQSHFGRHFRRLIGVTPTTYAQECDRRR